MARWGAFSPKICGSRTSRSPPTTSSCAATRPAGRYAITRQRMASRLKPPMPISPRRPILSFPRSRRARPFRSRRLADRRGKQGARFLDFNSASPGAKRRAAALIDGGGGRYVEGAVMTSIPPYRIKVPLLLGGAGAEALAPLLVELGFDAKVASKELGVASAVKMCRSVMIKGMEAMEIEAFTTARAYGVEDAVLASLRETYPDIEWEKQGAYFFQRVS